MERIPDDELIGAYLDDELSSEERARAERLLVERADLRRLLEELRAVREGLRSLPSYHLEEDFGAAVLRRAEKEILKERPPAIADAAEKPAGDPASMTAQPVATQPATTPSPVMPASVVASAESLAAREHVSGGAPAGPAGSGGPGDRFARWRRPVIWSIVAAAAAVVLMFVPPRGVDRLEDLALRPRSSAPEAATQKAVEGQAAPSDVERPSLSTELRRNESQDAPSDTDPARVAGAPRSDMVDRRSAVKNDAIRLGDAGFEASKSKDGTSGYGTVAGVSGGTTPAGQIPVGQVPATDPLAAKTALEPAASANRPISPLQMQSQAGGGAFGGQYARQIAELDQKRGWELVEKLQSIPESPAQREQLAESLQRRLATTYAGDESRAADQVLIVEIQCLPGAIENAFMPSLFRNKVADFSAPEGGSVATSQMALPITEYPVAGPSATVPASTAPVTKALAGIPLATTPVASPQSQTGLPAKAGEGYVGPARANDVAGVADEKKQQAPGEGQAVELRKSLVGGEEYYYIVADPAQLEGLLNELWADRRNFAGVRVEPAPRIETQQAWNQYSWQTPDDAGRSAASGTIAPSTPAAKPALKYGPGALGDLAGAAPAASAVPAPKAAVPAAPVPAASSSAIATSPTAPSPTAEPPAAGRAPSPGIAPSSPARGEVADVKAKADGKEPTIESSPTRSMPGQSAAGTAANPIAGGRPATTSGGAASDSPIANNAAAKIAAPTAGTLPPLVAPSADSHELRLAVPQSRALRVRQDDGLSLRGLARGRVTDPAPPARPLDESAGRRMLVGNVDREDSLRQQNLPAGGAVAGGAGAAPASPAPSAVAAPAVPAAPAPPAVAGLPPANTGTGTPLGKKADQVPANGSIAPAGPPSAAAPGLPMAAPAGSPRAAPPASQTAATSPPASVVPPSTAAQPVPAGGPVVPYGALRSETNSYADGQQAVTDALRRSGGRQEALFIFRVVREGEANSAYGDAVDLAKERPASAPSVSKPAAESSVPAPKPPVGKGG